MTKEADAIERLILSSSLHRCLSVSACLGILSMQISALWSAPGTEFIPVLFHSSWLNTIPKYFRGNRFCQMEKSGKQMCCLGNLFSYIWRNYVEELSLEECTIQIQELGFLLAILSQLQGYCCDSQWSHHIEKPTHLRPNPVLWLQVGGNDKLCFVKQHSKTIFIVILYLLCECSESSLINRYIWKSCFWVCCFRVGVGGLIGWIDN